MPTDKQVAIKQLIEQNKQLHSVTQKQNHNLFSVALEQKNKIKKLQEKINKLEEKIKNININVELKKKIKKLEEEINDLPKTHTEIEFDEDKMDNMLREQDLDWVFEKPLHKNYTKLYIEKIIHNGDTDNELPLDPTSIDYIYDSDSSDSE